MTSRYRAGADFERKVRDHLLAQGAVYVCRSAGSKGPVDLIAFYETDRSPYQGWAYAEFVQAKRDGRISKTDQWALCELAQQCGAIPVLARDGGRGKPPVLQVLETKEHAA